MVWVSVLQNITIYTLLAYCARRRAFLLFLSVRIPPDDKKKKKNFILSSLSNSLKTIPALKFYRPFYSLWALTLPPPKPRVLIGQLYLSEKRPPSFPSILDLLSCLSTYSNSSSRALTHFTESWITPLQPAFTFLFCFPSSLLWDLSSRLFSSFSPPAPHRWTLRFFKYDDLVSYHTLGFCKRIIPDFTLFISSELIQLDWKLLLVLQIEPKLPTAILLTVDHHGRRSCLTTKQHNPRVC